MSSPLLGWNYSHIRTMPSFSKIIVAALALGVAQAFSTPRSRATTRMTLESYKAELAKTAKSIASKGKGLLACDESTKTVGARLESIGMVRLRRRRSRRERGGERETTTLVRSPFSPFHPPPPPNRRTRRRTARRGAASSSPRKISAST